MRGIEECRSLGETVIARALLAAGFAACIVTGSLAGCSERPSKMTPPSASSNPSYGDLLSDVRERGTLVIATDPNYSPQSFRRPDGIWTGFDVEVGREIARRLGVAPRFEAADFDLVVRGSWLGRWDADIGSMSITTQRAKVLWFSKSYYLVPGTFAVRQDSAIRSVGDLADKRVGVGGATTYQGFLEGKFGKNLATRLHIQPVPYDADLHALRDLSTGNGRGIEAVFTSLPTIRGAIAAGMPLRVVDGVVYRDVAAIAFDRNSPRNPLRLIWAIDSAIDAMRKDGALSRLSVKYFGMDLSK